MLAALLFTGVVPAAEVLVLETEDGARIHADLLAGGPRGVILAHGGRYTRSSWKAQAEILNRHGYTVLAPDFRGHGDSVGPGTDDPYSAPLHLDLLACVRHLRTHGAESVAIVGGSLGGLAAGDAALHAKPGEIDAIVFLASTASLRDADISKLPGRKLFIVARDDRSGSGKPRLINIRRDQERVPPPSELRIFEGEAHAQELFSTTQGAEVMDAILRFLDAR